MTTKLETFKGFDTSFVRLAMFAVYKNPLDFKDYYVARLFDLDKPTQHFVIGKTEEAVVAKLPNGLQRLARNTNDDPVLVCTYL